MNFIVVIPARFASTRLPGKPLQDLGGKTMIQRVYERARQSRAQRVVVATDDPRIFNAVRQFGGEACMTSDQHPSGTDRLQEVAAKLSLEDNAVVVNVQGDEPLIPPAVIDQVAGNLASHPQASVATLCEPLRDAQELFNPNAVKVVSDERGFALYFSRAPLPWARGEFPALPDLPQQLPEDYPARRHIGLYAYRVAVLKRYVTWPPAQLEKVESLEQLRVLAHGEKIHVADACEAVPAGVDTPEDLARVRELLASA